MNDLELLREFRAELPYPERTRLTPGRSRLLSAARRPQRRRFVPVTRDTRPIRLPAARHNARSLLLPATAAAAAVMIAAALAGYALSAGSGPAAPKASATSSRSAAPDQAVLAARVLRDASAIVGRAPVAAVPRPGQWIYSKTVSDEYPQGVSSSEGWITFDGTKTAYYEGPGGPLVVHTNPVPPPADIKSDPLAAFNTGITPQTAYYALASLPTAPRQLLAVAAEAAQAIGAANLGAGTPVAGQMPKNTGQLEFDYLSLLLWNAAAGVGGPPAAEAAVFRAMAAISGVTVQQGITDAAGAPAIGVSDDGGYDQLLLDPHSYQVIGLRQLSTGTGPVPVTDASPQQLAKLPKAEQAKIRKLQKLQESKHPKTPPWPPKGAVVQSLAYAQVSEVSGPGIR
jgi:hypothetical protein